MRMNGAWTSALVALAVAGCGGGGGGSVAPATSKSAVGIVGGQSDSPTFAGQALIIQGAVTQNGTPAATANVQPGDLIVAQIVSSTAKAAGSITVKDVDIQVEIKGALTAVDVAGGSLQVLSQAVITDALTVIVEENADDSYSSLTLADLSVGDYVEVSGQRQADGSLLATRVERKRLDAADDGYDEVELRGEVSVLDAASATFQIGDQLVDYGTATVEGSLADGVRVEVEGQLNGDTLTASKVEVEDDVAGEADGEGEFEGPMTGLDTAAQTFALLGYTVDYSAASIEGTLLDGARVEVEGQFDAADPNLVHAESIEVKHESGGLGSADGEIKGAVANLDPTAGTFAIGDVSFYVSDITIIEIDDRAAALEALQDGDWVEVKLDSTQQIDGRILVLKIELEDSESEDDDGGDQPGAVEVKGAIAGFDAAGKTFVVNGYTVTVDSATTYEVGDDTVDETTFFSADRNGNQCEIKGAVNGDSIAATRVEIEVQDD